MGGVCFDGHCVRDYQLYLFAVDLGTTLPHNSSMRYLLLIAAVVPAMLGTPPSSLSVPSAAGAGRGLVNPPTVAELSERQCLATMIYGEARGEKETGQVAVAYSAVNRTRGKKSLCKVVLAPKQYSIFNNNPALRAAAQSLHLAPRQRNSVDQESWAQAQRVAEMVVARAVPDPTMGATHYLAPKVMAAKNYVYPRWSRQYILVTVIDNHRFYRPFYPKKKAAKT